ncbi:MAG TPA: pectin acetylesterase-family hydrolase [Anaeromyxobacter sp.]|nr:pectin acetylesterase-family hydrolase [Anaeromyxobacter sp.]
MRPLLARVAAVVLALLSACGGHESQQPPPLQTGWNAVDGMLCADGSPTGVGVSFGTRNRVLVVLSGGGACWSQTDCKPNTPRSFGATEFALASNFTANTILDRTLAGNPFSDWTFVFVPYCTGDVHAGGDVTRTYGGVSWRHHGRANLDAAISRIAAAVPSPEKVVIAGSSAGGFGALFAFDLARSRWPAGASGPKAYLVDDSGQTFVGSDLPQSLRDAWWTAWNLDATVTPLCAGCRTDLSQLWDVLHVAHPADRLALLSSTQDATMIGFFSPIAATAFQAAVGNLAAKLRTVPNAASFVVSGSAHALLLQPGAFAAGGATLTSWLAQAVNDDPSWTSAGP